MFERAATGEHRRVKSSTLMRSFVVVVSLGSLLFATSAGAENEETNGGQRRLGGHLFMYPASIDNAFVQTTFGTRTSVRYERANDVPIGSFSIDVNALGVQESAALSIAFADTWSVGVTALGQFLTGVSGESLATQGAIYDYGAALNGAFRIFRIESSGTQLNVRAELFGLQGGARLSILPLLVAIHNQPRSVVEEIGSFGQFLTTPSSWWGFSGSVNLAQAISPMFSVQASFRLALKRFTQSPFMIGQGRVDFTSTGWLPQAGVAFGVNPPGFPVSFLAEYRTAAQDVHDPASIAHHIIALGVYYSARPNLQLGPIVFGEFGLPEVRGFDVNGGLTSSVRPKAVSGQLMMTYFW
jgi:hypothetical protein